MGEDKDISKGKIRKENVHAGHRKRMYEKLLSGVNLAEHELLEMLLYMFIPRGNTNETAHLLLKRFGSIENVLEAKEKELTQIEGIGKKTAANIKLLRLLTEEVGKTEELKPPKRFSFRSVKEYLEAKLTGYETERMLVLFVDGNNRITSCNEFEEGTERQVQVNLSELSKLINASEPYGIVVAHNHPSGMPYPSADDNETMMKIALMLNYTGCEFIDNIIIAGKDKYYSYKAEGRLEGIVREGTVVKFLDYMKKDDWF